MIEIDNFLTSLFENFGDKNIKVYKRIRNNSRLYYIDISSTMIVYGGLIVTIDVDNRFIELNSTNELKVVTIESLELSTKWGKIIANYLDEKLDDDIMNILLLSLDNPVNKHLLRGYKINKIEDESL